MAGEREPLRARTPSPDLLAAREGDAVAFDRLLRPMLGKLLALAQRLAAAHGEELLQEALIRAHRGLPSFRMDCSFRSWLYGILFRLASEPRRFRGPALLAGEDAIEQVPDALGGDPFERASARDLLRRVEAAMERLPLQQRTALHLRSVEGWGYEEIARALETSISSARNAVMHARRKLRDRLGEEL